MKKLILTTIACTFIAAPVFAGDFQVEQAKSLEKIADAMGQFKDDAAKMDFLTQQKECVVHATELKVLNDCLATLPSLELKTTPAK